MLRKVKMAGSRTVPFHFLSKHHLVNWKQLSVAIFQWRPEQDGVDRVSGHWQWWWSVSADCDRGCELQWQHTTDNCHSWQGWGCWYPLMGHRKQLDVRSTTYIELFSVHISYHFRYYISTMVGKPGVRHLLRRKLISQGQHESPQCLTCPHNQTSTSCVRFVLESTLLNPKCRILVQLLANVAMSW